MLFLTTAKVVEEITLPNALLLSLVGFGVVFIALISIIIVIKIIASLSQAKKTPSTPVLAASAAGSVPAAPGNVSATPASGKFPAPGSQGEIDLYTVDDKTAALLMAIVADDLKAPLNTLRFTSIREVK